MDSKIFTREAVDIVHINRISDDFHTVEFCPAKSGDRHLTDWVVTEQDLSNCQNIDDVLSATTWGCFNPELDIINTTVFEEGDKTPPVILYNNGLRKYLQINSDGSNNIARFDFFDHALLVPGQDMPLNRLIRVEFSAHTFHLDILEPILSLREEVKAMYRDPGRPGSYDHVPASLVVTAKLQQDTWETLAYAASPKMTKYLEERGRKIANPGGWETSHYLEKLWSLENALRKEEYEYPSDKFN